MESYFHLKFLLEIVKIKKWRHQFRVIKDYETNICIRISLKKIECLSFCGDSNMIEAD